ncbi:MAG: hypothetical protein OXG08_00880 [Gammaproteobacteria bacterium]|nr:hypothetical protein [Gammaproteobacteria bacterium]
MANVFDGLSGFFDQRTTTIAEQDEFAPATKNIAGMQGHRQGGWDSMTSYSCEGFAAVSMRRHLFTVALAAIASLLAISGLSQESKLAPTDQAPVEATPESKYTKDSVRELTTEELADLIGDCGDAKLSEPDCVLLRNENSRRMQENDRPVDLASIKKPERPFGSGNQSETNPTEMPELVDIPQTPPNSMAGATNIDNVVTSDPRDVRDGERTKPPASIPSLDRPDSQKDERSSSTSSND